MAIITWTVEADFDLDETYETDLTPRAGGPGGRLSVDRGIDLSGRYNTSSLSIMLDNEDAELTEFNTGSELYGFVQPRVPIRLKATFDSIEYVLWTGYIDEISSSWEANNIHLTKLQCVDLSGFLSTYEPIYVTASSSRDTDGALIAIMDAINLNNSQYQFDDGQANLPQHFVVGTDALSAIIDVVKSEMGGLFWVDADGKLIFESRSSRLGTVYTRTWGDGTEIIPSAQNMRQTSRDIISRCEVIETLFSTTTAEIPVQRWSRGASTGDSVQIAANSTYGPVFVSYTGIATSIIAPEASVDYKANSAIDGSGTDRTANITIDIEDLGGGAYITVRNSFAGAVYLTLFQLRGVPVAITGSKPHYTAEKQIPGIAGISGVQLDIPFGGDQAGQKGKDYCISTLYTYRYPYPILELYFEWAGDDLTTEMLDVEIGDLVYYKDTARGAAGAYVDDLWYVEGIRHNNIQGGDNPVTAIRLIPAYMYRNLDDITYDTFTRPNTGSTLGVSLSGDSWQNDSGFRIISNKARGVSDTAARPYINLTSYDGVAEVTLEGVG